MSISMRRLFTRPGNPGEEISFRRSLARIPGVPLSLRQAKQRLAGFITLEKEKSNVRFLRPNDFMNILFTPLAGSVTIGAIAIAEDIKLPGPPRPDPDDPVTIRTEGKIRIDLFDPEGGSPVRTEVVSASDIDQPSESLKFEIPEEQSRRQWRCRFTNTGRKRVRCSSSVIFAEKKHQLYSTAIPNRVLNNAARQLIDILGLKIHLNSFQSYVDVSEELKELTGNQIERITFEIDVPVVTVNTIDLNYLLIQAPSPNLGGTSFQITMTFEEIGKEIDLPWPAPDLDIFNLGAKIDIELKTSDVRGKRSVWPNFSVNTNLRVDQSGIRGRFVDGFDYAASKITAVFGNSTDELDDVAKIVKSKLEGLLNSGKVPISKYLTEGFVQLAQRGHVFYDLSADSQNFYVKHYDPKVEFGDISTDEVDTPIVRTVNATVQDLQALDNLDKIEHIVYLMMENRSFDHMLGYLSHPDHGGRSDVDGLTGTESNSAQGIVGAIKVHPLKNTRFLFSPAHNFCPVKKQVANGKMSGFLESFIERFPNQPPEPVMGFYTKEHVPTFDFFAQHFMICDRWFSTHPGPTWPNRQYSLGGSTPYIDNFAISDPILGFLKLPTIFDYLNKDDWVYYEQEVAFLRMYDRYRLNDSNVIPFYDSKDGFKQRVMAGTLPKVTFIDPKWVDSPPVRTANDDHPPANISMGQDNIACIYDLLVSSPQWPKMMFVITYDEHGGFHDHVKPPFITKTIKFSGVNLCEEEGVGDEVVNHLGVRVPAFVISPWVPKNSVSSTIFDHTSVLKTILLKLVGQRFPEMGPFVQEAKHLGSLLSNDRPRFDLPKINPPDPPVRPDTLVGPKPDIHPDDFHKAMSRFGIPLFPP